MISFSRTNTYWVLNMRRVPTKCKVPKVVTLNEVLDLEGLIAGRGVALGMEGLVDQGKKLTFFPSCYVPEYKSPWHSVLLSSFCGQEAMAQRECSDVQLGFKPRSD